MLSVAVLLCLVTSFLTLSAHGIETYSSSLSQVEKRARESSPQLKATDWVAKAAHDQAEASSGAMYPKVNLLAGYVHLSDPPSIELSPGMSKDLGLQNISFAGLGITYNLFNGFRDSNNSKSAKANALAKEQEFSSQKRQLRHSVRLAYFGAQLAAENLKSTMSSLKLSQAEYRDTLNKVRAGSATSLDLISMEQENLQYQAKFQRAQSNLASAVRQLLAVTADSQNMDLSRPMPKDVEKSLPKEIEEATALIDLEKIDETLSSLSKMAQPQEVNLDLPELKSLEYSTQASEYSAKAYNGGYWPSISLGAQALRVAPADFLPSEMNVLYANLAWNLYEGGTSKNQESQQRSLAKAAEFQREQKAVNLKSDFVRYRDSIKAMWSEEKINRENKAKAEQAAKLVRSSYNGGRSRMLDVQTANQRLFDAQFAYTQVQYQLLVQYAEFDLLTLDEQADKE